MSCRIGTPYVFLLRRRRASSTICSNSPRNSRGDIYVLHSRLNSPRRQWLDRLLAMAPQERSEIVQMLENSRQEVNVSAGEILQPHAHPSPAPSRWAVLHGACSLPTP